jgi:outer membrane protein assembly factor BamA
MTGTLGRAIGWFAVVLALGALSTQGFAAETVSITEIIVEGLDRTRPHIVHQELRIAEGDEVSPDDVEAAVQRVRNLEIFDTVEYELAAYDTGQRLRVIVTERWTILPILQFSFGGDVTRIRLGVYDLNILGRHLEIGGEYRYIAGTHSFGAWFYEPRLLGHRLRFEVEAWRDREVFFRHDQEGQPMGGFLRRRTFLRLGLVPELATNVRLVLGARLDRTGFVLDGLPQAYRQVQDEAQLTDTTWVGRWKGALLLGRLDRRGYLQFGQELEAGLEVFRSIAGARISHVEPQLRLLFFRELPLKSNLGVRLEWRATTAQEIGFHQYVGGLDHVRGYPYSRFHGKTYINGNVEYRIPSLDSDWLAIQHVAFVDALSIGDGIGDLVGLTAASVGIGLRLIVPRVYGLILRVDFAYPLGAPGESFLNIGSLQFF